MDDAPPSSLRRDIASAYLVTLSRIASWVVVSALVYRRMGANAFAALALVRATVGLFNYASLGIAPAMVHLLAKIHAAARPVLTVEESTEAAAEPAPVLPYATPSTNREEPEAVISPLQSLYLSGVSVLVASAVIGGVALIFYAGFFASGVIPPPAGLKAEMHSVVLLFGAGVLLRLISDAPGAVLQTAGRITTDNLLLAAAELLWVILSLLWMSDDWNDLPYTGLAFTLAAGVLLFARFIAAGQVAPIGKIKTGVDFAAAKTLLTFGLLVTLAQAADYLYAPTDYLLINQLLGPLVVAVYAPAVLIDGGLLLLVSGLASVLLPTSALAHAAGDRLRLRRHYILGTLASLALLIPAAIAVYLLSERIFRLWLNDPMPATRAILPLVLIHTVIGGSSAVGRSILLGMGKVKTFTTAVLIAGAANVLLSYIFVRHLHLGLPGIIYGTIVVVIARCALWMPWYIWRTLATPR